MSRIGLSTSLAFLLVVATGASPRQSVAGRWEGTVDIGAKVPFSVVFTDDAAGLSAKIDIQGAKGLPLTAVKTAEGKVHFELPTGVGVAVFDGTFDGTTIAGAFVQNAARGPFTLTREGAPKPPPPARAPVPYKEEDVTFTNGPITLAGTLTIPEGTGPFPAFVMVTGSGLQNRDEELFGFKPFAVIADYLARHGVATLRTDDRGAGGSTGTISTSTTADFADDALAGLALLKTRPEIDPSRRGVFGHSEGGEVAAIAAAKAPKEVAFIIMMAGPAQSGAAILRQQTEDGAKSVGATSEQVAAILTAHQKVMAAEASNGPVADLTAALRELITAQLNGRPVAARLAIGNISTMVDERLPGAVAQGRAPWMRYFVAFDPATVLDHITCPVFGMFGEKDTQVRATLNKPILESALARAGNTRSTIKVYPAANHLFITANTGAVSEYETLDKTFVPGLLDDLVSFVKGVR